MASAKDRDGLDSTEAGGAPSLNVEDAYLILNAIPDIGPVLTSRLLAAFQGDVLAIFRSGEADLRRVDGIGARAAKRIQCWAESFDLSKERKGMRNLGIVFRSREDPCFPAILQQLNDCPLGLYWKGDYEITDPCIAIVGSRRASLYGTAVAKKLGAELAKLGFCVVSGMARGTDTAAHEGALEAGGKTVAVYGCGMHTTYPPENLELSRRIAATGALLSEFPLARRADRQTFPMRNRIVAGLSQAIIVVESDLSGGSMITARFAGEQGRQVFAVPGRIDQPSSRGCHQLIREGATLVTGVDDILDELNYRRDAFQLDLDLAAETREVRNQAAKVPQPELSADEAALFSKFGNGEAIHPDELADLSGFPSFQVSGLLMQLELKGLLIKRVDGRFEAKSGFAS